MLVPFCYKKNVFNTPQKVHEDSQKKGSCWFHSATKNVLEQNSELAKKKEKGSQKSFT